MKRTAIDADHTWLCEHVTRNGAPAASTRLSVSPTEAAKQRSPGYRVHSRCPACGTLWRVWLESREASPMIEWDAELDKCALRRPRVLDIEQIIALVVESIPSTIVSQYDPPFVADDAGVWIFAVPGNDKDIQLESATGMCPFLVEHNSMKSTSEAIMATSIQQAVDEIVRYLR